MMLAIISALFDTYHLEEFSTEKNSESFWISVIAGL